MNKTNIPAPTLNLISLLRMNSHRNEGVLLTCVNNEESKPLSDCRKRHGDRNHLVSLGLMSGLRWEDCA